MQRCGAKSHGMHVQSNPQMGTMKKGRKHWKNQRIRDFAVRLGLLVTSQDTPVKPPQRELPPQEVDKEDTNRQAKLVRKVHKASVLHKELQAIN